MDTEGYTFLHSGYPLPCDQERGTRNEGVGIALDKKATAALEECRRSEGNSQFQSGDGTFDVDRAREEELWEA